MNNSQSQSSVVKVIKNYVVGCGGDVTLSALTEDYLESFSTAIPYSKFGHQSLIDFLISIPGLTVIICDGEYHIKTRWAKSTDSSESTHSKLSADMSLLCVEMKNNLIVSDSAAQRKVTVKEGNPLKYSKNNAPKRYNLSYFGENENYVPSSGYSSENYCTTYSPFDYNSCYAAWNDYNSFESDECTSFAHQDVYSNPVNNGYYDSLWEQPYIPQASFYDSPLTYEKGTADTNSTFCNDRNFFSQSLSSSNYNGLFSSLDVSKNSDADFSNQPPPVSEKQVIKRLVSLVNAHQKEIASSALEFQYLDTYSDTLPKNWSTLLEESHLLFMEHFTSSLIIYPNRSFSSIPTILDLPKLDLPCQMPWSVSITTIRSVDSIWFRLNEKDLDGRYHILCQQMKKHYQGTLPGQILSVELHQLFVATFKNKLLRVCVIGRPENGTCKCLAIDEGITEIFPFTSLMMLHEKFTNTPKLIMQGSLASLNKFTECSHIRNKLEKMLTNVNTSVIVEKSEAGKFLLNLLVTKPNDCDSVNVNEYLLDVIKRELNLPELKMNQIFDVVVLSLSMSLGDNVAKVQIKSPSLELLQKSLRECGHIIACTHEKLLFAKNLIDVQLNQLYLAKYSDGTWQRVLLKQFVNSTHVVVVFVDFQDIQALEITKIICYAHFPDALTYIPPQGVTVNIVKTDHEVLKLINLKLKTNSFSMKVIRTDPKLFVQMYLKAPQETYEEDICSANLKQFCCSAV